MRQKERRFSSLEESRVAECAELNVGDGLHQSPLAQVSFVGSGRVKEHDAYTGGVAAGQEGVSSVFPLGPKLWW